MDATYDNNNNGNYKVITMNSTESLAWMFY